MGSATGWSTTGSAVAEARRFRWPGGATRWRITAAATASAALLLGVGGVVGLEAVHRQQEWAAEARAITQISTLQQQLRVGVLPELYAGEFPYEIVAGDGDILAAQFSIVPYQDNGPVVPAPGLVAAGQDRPVDDGALRYDTGSVTLDSATAPTGLNGLTLPAIWTDLPASAIALDGLASDARVRIAVLITPFAIDEVVAGVRGALLIAIPIVLLVIALVVWWSVGRALRPIGRIGARMRTITAENLDARVPEPATGDEVESLALAVNRTLARLAEADRAQRAFVSDAAHELRSPITALASTVEISRLYPEHVDPAETAAAVARQVERLTELSENLLTLARLEQPVDTVDPVDLVTVVQQAIDATPATVPVRWSAPDHPLRVVGDTVELGRAVTNVLANAQRHARSTVTVTVSSDEGTAVLSITNDGSPLADTDLERIFDRLVRLDEARGLDTGGTGLGLAITLRIVQRHHGTIRALNTGDGVAFEFRFPTL